MRKNDAKKGATQKEAKNCLHQNAGGQLNAGLTPIKLAKCILW